MATFFGVDTSCVTDLSRIDVLVTDPSRLICERLARRCQTPRGGLAVIGDDPGGIDLRQYVNAKMGPNERRIAEGDVRAECLKDEQVQSVDVTSTFVAGVLAMNITGVASTGPFALTLNVTNLTVALVFG